MTEGWIALHRKIFSSKDFSNQLEVAVFIYLVSMACHRPTQVTYRKKKLSLKRGEVSIAYKDLAKRFELSERRIRTIIRNLVASGNVDQTLTRNLSIYSIVKYSKYQDMPSKADQTLTDRTTTNTNILYSIDKNVKSLTSMTDKPKPKIATLQSLKSKIYEKPKEMNEWQIMREKLDADDFERYVRLKLNS